MKEKQKSVIKKEAKMKLQLYFKIETSNRIAIFSSVIFVILLTLIVFSLL
jgi:type IV secretory pathway component VirB8